MQQLSTMVQFAYPYEKESAQNSDLFTKKQSGVQHWASSNTG